MSKHLTHYDKIADEYAAPRQTHLCTRLYWAYYYRTMMDLVSDDLSSMRALDCMSGPCEFAWTAKSRVRSLHAVDISSGILQKAIEPLPDTRTCADARQLPYADSVFDVVFVSGGLHHLRKEYEEVLSEIFRVTKSGGWVIVSEPNDDNVFIHLMRGILHIVSPLYEEGERGFKRNEILAAFSKVGYSHITSRKHGYLAYALIGNTDVFPVFRNLKNATAINSLINIDRKSDQIPIWRDFALLHLITARVIK